MPWNVSPCCYKSSFLISCSLFNIIYHVEIAAVLSLTFSSLLNNTQIVICLSAAAQPDLILDLSGVFLGFSEAGGARTSVPPPQ